MCNIIHLAPCTCTIGAFVRYTSHWKTTKNVFYN